MDIEHINEMRAFSKWARDTLKKASTFDIVFWAYTSNDIVETEYKIYVDGLISKTSNCLYELCAMIPKFKQFCELKMEISE